MNELPEYTMRNLTSQTARIKMLAHRKSWIDTARPNQLPPPGQDWDIWLYLAGRGNGKTRLAAEKVAWDTWNEKNTITHVVASTHGDLRSVCYEGESGLIGIIPPECIKPHGYNRSLGEIYLTNGSIIRGFSAEAPERARGPQCHRLWGDELAAWDQVKGGAREMFDQAMFGLRLGNHSYALLTTTPKPIQLIRNLVDLSVGKITERNQTLKDLRVIVTRGSTSENFSNLSRNFQILISQYTGTRLGRQELEAEILEDIQGALWSNEVIDRNRLPSVARIEELQLERIVVSIDPAASTEEGSDETGVIVGGCDAEGHAHILEDASGKYTPNEWGELAIKLYHKYQADLIIGEVNNGGDMVENTITGINSSIPFKGVRASRGKVARAEPVSALYDQNKVHHRGVFNKLEDQMTAFTTGFNRTKAGYSPDRMDAMVWLVTEVLLGDMDSQGIFEYYRRLAANGGVDIKAEKVEIKTVLMGSNNPEVPTIFGKNGIKYVVATNGTVRVNIEDAAAFKRLGFREMEQSN